MFSTRNLTHLLRMDSSTSTLWTGPLPIEGVSVKSLLLPCFIEFPVLNTNSVDPNQTPRSVASDLCLPCKTLNHRLDFRFELLSTI